MRSVRGITAEGTKVAFFGHGVQRQELAGGGSDHTTRGDGQEMTLASRALPECECLGEAGEGALQ